MRKRDKTARDQGEECFLKETTQRPVRLNVGMRLSRAVEQLIESTRGLSEIYETTQRPVRRDVGLRLSLGGAVEQLIQSSWCSRGLSDITDALMFRDSPL